MRAPPDTGSLDIEAQMNLWMAQYRRPIANVFTYLLNRTTLD
jgi:hypothetical protein